MTRDNTRELKRIKKKEKKRKEEKRRKNRRQEKGMAYQVEGRKREREGAKEDTWQGIAEQSMA